MIHCARAFGHDWVSDIPLDQFDAGTSLHNGAQIALKRVEALVERADAVPIERGWVFAGGFRFRWGEEVMFDVVDRQIDYLPGLKWRGRMPATFYSTVAALTLAGRGLVPLHASAVELNGKVWLLAGHGGAGKSTLAAELLGAGARLVGDDLSLLDPANDFAAARGRPAMRLHPASAARVAHEASEHVPDDPRGKLLVRPSARVADAPLPLAGAIVLAEGAEAVAQSEAVRIWPQLLFRPRWCRALPGHGVRRAQLLALASKVPMVRLPPVQGFGDAERKARVARALAGMGA